MRSLALRFTTGVAYACVFFAAAATVLAVLGITAVHRATTAGNSVATDELATARITAEVGQRIDSAYTSGLRVAMATGRERAILATELTGRELPAVEAALADLRQIHVDDGRAELAGIAALQRQWATARGALNAVALAGRAATAPVVARELSAAITPPRRHVQTLVDRERDDAAEEQAHASRTADRVTWLIIGATALAVLASAGLALLAARRIRRAVRPAEEQIEFADTMQLAGDENEANNLLLRHLERTVTDSTVVVLNRNNSADRLEAATPLPVNSPLVASLDHAEPRSCLAVRSGRSHSEAGDRQALLGCPVCKDCPGASTCTPLTVGGEVIGSVLVNRARPYQDQDRQHIRESVGQAAPALANLRNLAIAELRAATDSLTGLPNKRAVGDTLKRMFAQASRTLTPLSLVLLDLDHFKDINDRHGHPVGDQALANVGAALRAALRDSDFAGRNGGEEFAIMLPDTDLDGALLTAEKIREAVAGISVPGLDLHVTASLGVASYPTHATSSERLERLADAALYVAKRTGRNRVEIAAAPSGPGTPAALAPGGGGLPYRNGTAPAVGVE
jgi:diguanylate cyclase (GGDEF)-like protein